MGEGIWFAVLFMAGGLCPARAEAPVPEQSKAGAGTQGKSEGEGKGKGKEDTQENKGPATIRKGPWILQPWYEPVGGLEIITGDGGESAAGSLGFAAGVDYRYRRTPFQGTSRAEAVGLLDLASDTTGWGTDVRVGTFAGPQYDYFGAELGLDGFHNQYTSGGVELEPTFGVDVPLRLTARYEDVEAFVGAATALVSNPERRVDWDTVGSIGIGHEFEWFAGLGGTLFGFSGSIQYTHRVLADGVSRGVTGSIGLSGDGVGGDQPADDGKDEGGSTVPTKPGK